MKIYILWNNKKSKIIRAYECKERANEDLNLLVENGDDNHSIIEQDVIEIKKETIQISTPKTDWYDWLDKERKDTYPFEVKLEDAYSDNFLTEQNE